MSLRVVVRWRTARSRLARFVTGSLAAHGVLVAVILVLPMMRPAPQTFDDAMVVALAGPLPGPPAAPAPAAARPSAPAPAPPPKAPEPKEAHAVQEIPKPKPSPPPRKKEGKKDDAPVRPPAPSAPPGPPADETREPTPGSGASTGGPGGTGPTGVTAVLGGGDASLGFYGATVKAALESAWIKPPLEDQGETYSATVMFVIARDGTVRDARIAEPSGVPSLDRSVLRAVLEASPFPPIPPSWQGDSLPATMRFDLNPEGR